MYRHRHEFDQVGIRRRCVRVWGWQRFTFLQQQLRKVFQRTGDHQSSIGQIEALACCPREIESLRDHHLGGYLWKIESHVVAEHTSMILHGKVMLRNCTSGNIMLYPVRRAASSCRANEELAAICPTIYGLTAAKICNQAHDPAHLINRSARSRTRSSLLRLSFQAFGSAPGRYVEMNVLLTGRDTTHAPYQIQPLEECKSSKAKPGPGREKKFAKRTQRFGANELRTKRQAENLSRRGTQHARFSAQKCRKDAPPRDVLY